MSEANHLCIFICSPGHSGEISENTTVKNSSKSNSIRPTTLPQQRELTTLSESPKLHDSVASVIPPNQSKKGNSSSTVTSSSQQPVLLDHQLMPETVLQPAASLPSKATGSSTQAAPAGSVTSAGITSSTDHFGKVQINSVQMTSAAITTSTTNITLVLHETTTKPMSAAATTTITSNKSTISMTTTTTKTTLPRTRIAGTITTTKYMKKSSAAIPLPNTGIPPVSTTSLPIGPATGIAVTIALEATTNQRILAATGMNVAVVDVAGAALTRQLVDTASLLAVLLFGLMFFLVTVAVFLTQAFESYRRKDYTQVDFLINGMYTDSGV